MHRLYTIRGVFLCSFELGYVGDESRSVGDVHCVQVDDTHCLVNFRLFIHGESVPKREVNLGDGRYHRWGDLVRVWRC